MTDEEREDRARKGGYARAERLTAEERSESARRAAEERWRRDDEHFSDATATAALAKLRGTS